MNNWKEVNLVSYDITGVHLHGPFGSICVINIYNDCENNGSLEVVEEYMRRKEGRGEVGDRGRSGKKESVIWLGDFNRHHPLWDEERNTHLFTKNALEATQPLLDMISEYDLHMALPKDIPTLEASSTKNYTRVDNVFCSPDIFDCFIECNTYPHWHPQKTDCKGN